VRCSSCVFTLYLPPLWDPSVRPFHSPSSSFSSSFLLSPFVSQFFFFLLALLPSHPFDTPLNNHRSPCASPPSSSDQHTNTPLPVLLSAEPLWPVFLFRIPPLTSPPHHHVLLTPETIHVRAEAPSAARAQSALAGRSRPPAHPRKRSECKYHTILQDNHRSSCSIRVGPRQQNRGPIRPTDRRWML